MIRCVLVGIGKVLPPDRLHIDVVGYKPRPWSSGVIYALLEAIMRPN
jgi:hypothetical protein